MSARTLAVPIRSRQPWSRRAVLIVGLKVVLPLVAVLLMAAVLLWPYLTGGPGAPGQATITDGDRSEASMVKARYVGADGENRPFQITADAVHNLGAGQAVVMLDAPEADMVMANGTWVMVTADQGEYVVDSQALRLSGAVKLFHDAGYLFESSEAQVDLIENTVSGSKPVRGQGPVGTITAEGFSVSDGGDTVAFTGQARLVIFPGAMSRVTPSARGAEPGT